MSLSNGSLRLAVLLALGQMAAWPQAAPAGLPTLFVIGDSTVHNGRGDGAGGLWGWGEPLADYFDPGKIRVLNRALGGRSSRTFITEGHWDAVLEMLQPDTTTSARWTMRRARHATRHRRRDQGDRQSHHA